MYMLANVRGESELKLVGEASPFCRTPLGASPEKASSVLLLLSSLHACMRQGGQRGEQ